MASAHGSDGGRAPATAARVGRPSAAPGAGFFGIINFHKTIPGKMMTMLAFQGKMIPTKINNRTNLIIVEVFTLNTFLFRLV